MARFRKTNARITVTARDSAGCWAQGVPARAPRPGIKGGNPACDLGERTPPELYAVSFPFARGSWSFPGRRSPQLEMVTWPERTWITSVVDSSGPSTK